MLRLALLAILAIPASASTPNPKSLSSYLFDASRPAEERISDIPDWLLRVLQKVDEAPGYRPYHPSAKEKLAWAQAVGGLPPRMQKALDDRLIATYFIEGLKSNGITDWVLDPSSRVYVYMIFNPAAFRQTLSETLTERERSVFRGNAFVSVDVGTGGSGIIYSVAHECAHAFDFIVGLTPYTEPWFGATLARPLNVSWSIWSSYEQPQPRYDFPSRRRLNFYNFKPPILKPAEASRIYAQFSRLPLVSLYGAKNWAEYAAELFVFHHLTTTLGRPYRIHVGVPDKGEMVIEPMSNRRLQERAEQILAPIY